MSNAVANLLIKIGADVGEAVRKVGGAGDSFKKSLEAALPASNAVAAGVGVAAAAMGALFAKGIMDNAGMLKIMGQTEAVIKSTGAAAGVSAEGVGELAGKLERMSGMSAESIQQGQNLLLTFTNIKNGVGEGNDIFNQTTAIMTDLATAMGTEPKAAAIQLGKALNDPVAGVSALSRVGVSFTEGQKATIKSLVDSGKTMEAQKVILAELNKEFGGSAEAAGKQLPGALERANNAFGDIFEALSMPVMEPLTAATIKAAETMAAFADTIAEKGLTGAIPDGLKVGMMAVAGAISVALIPAAVALATTLTTSVIPAFIAAVTPIAPFLAAGAAVGALAGLIMVNWEPIKGFFVGLWNSILGGVQALVEGFRKGFDFVGQIVAKIVAFIREKFGPIADLLPDSMKAAIKGAGDAALKLPALVIAPYKDTALAVVGAAKGMASGVGGAVKSGVDQAKALFQNAAQAVPKFAGQLVDGVGTETAKLTDKMGKPAKAAVAKVQEAVQNVNLSFGDLYAKMRQIDAEEAFFGGKTEALKAKLAALKSKIQEAMAFTGPLTKEQVEALEALKKTYKGLEKDLEGLEKKAEPAKSAMDSFKASTTDVLNSVNGLRDGLRTIGETLGIELNNVVLDGAAKLGNFGLAVVQVATSASTLTGMLQAANIATHALTAAQWLWNVAMNANPIGLIVAGVVALGVVGKLLADNWGKIGETMGGIWEGMKSAAVGAFEAIGRAIAFIWDGIILVLKAPFNFMISSVNALISAINTLRFDVPDWVPGIGGNKFGFNVPQIPYLAKGGVVTGPTLAMVGEGRDSEAVLPLNRNVFGQLGAGIAGALAGPGLAYAGGGDTYITFNIDGARDPESVADEIVRILRRKGIR